MSAQIMHVPIFLLYRQNQRITSCMLLCGTVSSWGCAASLLHSSETGTVPVTACVSCGLCLSAWLGKLGSMPGWHNHMASNQGISSFTAIDYFCWAAQTSKCYLSASAASQMSGTNWDDYPSVLICRTDTSVTKTDTHASIEKMEKKWPKNCTRSPRESTVESSFTLILVIQI